MNFLSRGWGRQPGTARQRFSAADGGDGVALGIGRLRVSATRGGQDTSPSVFDAAFCLAFFFWFEFVCSSFVWSEGTDRLTANMSRGPPDRIKFKVKAVTSEDPDHPVTEVHLLAPHSRGWRSEKFCSYPQDMLLDLSRPTHVHQIQVSWLASRFTLDLRPLLPFPCLANSPPFFSYLSLFVVVYDNRF